MFDIGQEGSQPYIVSQLLDGGSVDERLHELEAHKLPIAEALRIALQIAQALEHAHSIGIVHRDLKPGNVWLARDGTAKLGDFGLAVALDQSRLTQEGMLVGTVAYMPPEQAMGRTLDTRSDLYALGAMLYEMVAGRPPFLGDDAVTVISQHVSTPPVAPSWHNHEVPAALEGLIQQLLAKDPAARPQRASDVVAAIRRIQSVPAESAAPPPTTGPADTRRRAAWGRFVGRREELDQLKEVLEDALGGRGSLAMLVGEPGIGKTRLAEEFAVYARLRGAQVLSGRSYEGAVEVPYFPFIEAFRQYVRARPDADLRRELGEGAPDVANLVSEIRQRFPDLPTAPPLQGDAERLRLFGSITEFLRAAAAAGPLVLHLDDLHWADKPSLLLLRHLARHLSGERLLFVGSYRDVELDRTHPLAEVLGTLRRETSFRRILLRGLPTSDVVAYLTALADEEPDPAVQAARQALAEALERETEGNPFFIGEVLSHLVESGKLYWDGTHWRANVTSASELGIPEGVREVVGRRLSALGDVCNRMLTVASAMPAGFGWDVLRATVEGEEAALLDALEEALAARLVRERPGAQGSYEFTHALIRQTLYEELSAPRRVLLHRRIGERLEALHAGNPTPHLAELAHHFFQAAPGGDVDKAVNYAMRAGQRAVSVAAFEEATASFERAIQALELHAGRSPEQACRARLALAEVHARVGAVELSRAEAGLAAELARATGSAELLALAALNHGGEHVPAFGFDEVRVRLLEEAHAAFGTTDNELVVRLLRRQAMEFGFVDAARAEALARQAVAIARRIGTPAALAYALSGLHYSLGAADRLDERLLISSELLAVATEAGMRDFVSLGHWTMHFDLLEKGDAARARVHLDGYVAIAKQTREPSLLWLSVVFQGLWATLEGRFDEAERLANEALELARKFDHPGGPQFHAIQISRVRAEQGRLAEMIPVVEAIVKATPLSGWRARLVQLYAEFGREEEARREFELLAADDFAIIPQDNLWLLSLCWIAEPCAALRDVKRAEVLYRLLLPYAKRNVVVVNAAVNGSVERYLGKLAATLGHYDEAVRHFDAAIAFDRGLGARPLQARVQVDYARMLLERAAPGDRERALRLANEALAIAHELGMKLVTERALALKLEAQGVDVSDTRRSVYTVATLVQVARPDLGGAAADDGTVTLLFSDMEGFTRMTESLGDIAAHEVVQTHNRIVREQTAIHGGREVELRGDGFLLAFASARQAALCAISLQRALAAHNASNGERPIRIRIGVHTGEAIKDADKFFGKTVIQAFRIADLACGEEILTSSITAELLRSAGDLRFNGEREVELKGLEGRHRVYALEWH